MVRHDITPAAPPIAATASRTAGFVHIMPKSWAKYGEIYSDDDKSVVFVCTACLEQVSSLELGFIAYDAGTFWKHVEKLHFSNICKRICSNQPESAKEAKNVEDEETKNEQRLLEEQQQRYEEAKRMLDTSMEMDSETDDLVIISDSEDSESDDDWMEIEKGAGITNKKCEKEKEEKCSEGAPILLFDKELLNKEIEDVLMDCSSLCRETAEQTTSSADKIEDVVLNIYDEIDNIGDDGIFFEMERLKHRLTEDNDMQAAAMEADLKPNEPNEIIEGANTVESVIAQLRDHGTDLTIIADEKCNKTELAKLADTSIDLTDGTDGTVVAAETVGDADVAADTTVGDAVNVAAETINNPVLAAISYICPECEQVFNNAQNYKTHYEIHEQEALKANSPTSSGREPIVLKLFTCALCPKTFRWHKQLRRHYLAHSKYPNGLPPVYSTRPFPCHFCSRRTNTEKSLKKHIEKFHGDKVTKSQISVKKMQDLQEPQLNSTQGTIECKECGRFFKSSSSLKTHFKSFHTQNLQPASGFVAPQFNELSPQQKAGFFFHAQQYQQALNGQHYEQPNSSPLQHLLNMPLPVVSPVALWPNSNACQFYNTVLQN